MKIANSYYTKVFKCPFYALNLIELLKPEIT